MFLFRAISEDPKQTGRMVGDISVLLLYIIAYIKDLRKAKYRFLLKDLGSKVYGLSVDVSNTYVFNFIIK